MRAERENVVVVFFSTNKTSSAFALACSKVPEPYGNQKNLAKELGIEPTKRQASKWLMHKGAAYKFGRA